VRARELFQAGKLDAAIDALGAEVRDNPTDTQRRTFLFELLCFAGQYFVSSKDFGTFGWQYANNIKISSSLADSENKIKDLTSS